MYFHDFFLSQRKITDHSVLADNLFIVRVQSLESDVSTLKFFWKRFFIQVHVAACLLVGSCICDCLVTHAATVT